MKIFLTISVTLIQVVLIFLKVSDKITISWWLVLLPFLSFISGMILMFIYLKWFFGRVLRNKYKNRDK